jgi:predicted ATPase
MNERRPTFIHSLTLNNLLSFSPAPETDGTPKPTLKLGPLNVLIGPNGSGKSNLVEVLSLLHSLPTDLAAPIREGGGVDAWIWNGPSAGAVAELVVIVGERGRASLEHRIELGARRGRTFVSLETVLVAGQGGRSVFSYAEGRVTVGDEATPLAEPASDVVVRNVAEHKARVRVAAMESMILKQKRDLEFELSARWKGDQSVLAQWNDPRVHEISTLRGMYSGIYLYRDWDTSRNGALRSPARADMPDDFLLPNASNLPVVLSALQRHPKVWLDLRAALRRFLPSAEDVVTIVQGGTVQLFVRESGHSALTPGTRLSDGTLRYLALLSVLLHPEPPALVVIEEPELGLHPDLIGDVAKLLEQASEQCQVLVTTHSDHLVSALSHRPDAIVVAERKEAGTVLKRLKPAALASWLKKYRLGELWMNGEIGGTRW